MELFKELFGATSEPEVPLFKKFQEIVAHSRSLQSHPTRRP